MALSFGSWGVKVAAVTFVYVVAGRLALLQAIPPGYATAVWPAAGIALALLLLFGYRVWPGIWLGSFLVNAGTSLEAVSTASLGPLSIAASIGVGAALQASAGCWLVRRAVGYPTALDHERDIGRFVLLGGPVSCLVGATWGVATLVAAGAITAASAPFSWWTWWVGDSIGVIIFAPLALIFLGEPREVWRRRRAFVAAPLAVGFAVVTLLFVRASRWEGERLDAEFDRRAQVLVQALERRVGEYLAVVESVAGLYDTGSDVSHLAFRRFVSRSLALHPGIQALSWAPRVPARERLALEEAARRQGFIGFQVTEEDGEGVLVPAATRDEYVPVYYIEPNPGNEAALGFDLASSPERLEALERARDSGTLLATRPLRLVQETGEGVGFLAVAPVYAIRAPRATPEERRQALRGFATGAFSVREIVEVGLRGLDREGLVLRLEDEGAPPGRRLLYGDSNGAAGAWSTAFEVAGHRWRVHLSATADALAARRSWQAWMVLAGGLAFVGVLGVVLLLTTGRTAQVELRVTERTRELEQANRDLASAQGIAHLGSWRFDIRRNAVTWSDELYRIYGLAPQEITATLEAYAGRVHPGDRERVATTIRQAAADGKPFRFVERIVRPDGGVRVLESEGQVLRDAQGRPAEMVGICHDVTERKEGEAVAGRLAAIVESTAEAIIGATLEGVVYAWNPAAERLYGYSAAEMLGRPLSTLVPPDRAREVHERLLAVSGEQPAPFETFRLRKDGSRVEVRITPSVVPDAEGRPAGISALHYDLGAQRRAEEEGQRFFRLSLDPLCVTGTDGRFHDLNEAWQTTLGYSLDELKASPFLDFVHPEDRERTASEFGKLFGGRVTVAFENRYRHRDGSYRWFLWTAVPYLAEGAVYAAARDITGRKRMEAELARSNAELEQFAYVASHDLQEPLRMVSSFTQLLAEKYGGELVAEAQEFLGYATDGAVRMQGLIRDLLTYARVGGRQREPGPTDTEAVLGRVLADLGPALQAAGAAVSHDALPAVLANDTEIGQLFQNLVGNALKFHGPAPARIHVGCTVSGGEARFTVEDNGIGIASEHRERVFMLFQRLHTRQEYPGSGIGLAVCKKIVENGGGRIWIEPSEGSGTAIHFTLPLALGGAAP